MGFINKCSLCDNKGFLLKLENGLCEDCSTKLKALENEYTTLLQDISLNPTNIEDFSNKLSELMPSFEKYNNFSSVFSVESVSKLLENLSLKNTKNSINFKTNLKPISQNINSNSESNSNNNLSDNKDNDTSSEEIPDDNINLDNINMADTDTNTESQLYIEEVNKDYISQDTVDTPVINHSDKLIIDNLYNNVSNIMETLNDNTLPVNDLGKNFFILKESYYPLLNQYKINEVNGVNIKEYIISLERKLCHLTNTTSNTLYDFFNYVSLAIQTSGINKESNYILEISALKINYGDITDEFYTLINPMRTITADISKRTGITSDMVESYPTLDIALSNLKDFIEDYNLVAYNSIGVLGFLNINYNKLFGYKLKNKDTCALKLYRSRYKNYHGDAPKVYDLYNMCLDLLPKDDISTIEDFNSISKSTSLAVYKLYELLKYKYK